MVVFIEEKKCTVPASINPFPGLISLEIPFIRSVDGSMGSFLVLSTLSKNFREEFSSGCA